MRGSGTDFHVVGLKQSASVLVPVLLERKYDLLKGEHEQWPVKREAAKFFYFSVNCALAAEKRPQWGYFGRPGHGQGRCVPGRSSCF
jgi:hypothetical protein